MSCLTIWVSIFYIVLGHLLFDQCSAQALNRFDVDTGTVNVAVVSSRGQVFVGANLAGSSGCYLYSLDGNLGQRDKVQCRSGVSILKLALGPDGGTVVACMSDRSCIEYSSSNMTAGPVRVIQNAFITRSNDGVALVSAPVIGGGNSFYVGSSNGTVILIGQYGLDGAAGSVSRSSGNLFGVTAGSFTRNWFGGFVAGSYTYFVVLDVRTSPISRPGIRVLRVCDNSNETSVAAMYEAEINCFSSSVVDEVSTLVGASLLETFPGGAGATLVVGLSTPFSSTTKQRVCAVGLSSVDSAMNTASCSGTSLPWRATVSSAQSCPNRCNIPSPGAVEAPTPISSNADILINSNTVTYTSTLAFNYESLPLLFIAYTISGTTQSFLQAVSIYSTEILITLHISSPPPPPSLTVQHNQYNICSKLLHMANAWSCDQADMDQWTELCLCHHNHFSRPMTM